MTNICQIHNEAMEEKTGQYGKYWSHRTTDTNYPKGFCNGKVKQAPVQALDDKTQMLIYKNTEVILERLTGLAVYLKQNLGDAYEAKVKEDKLKQVPF